jgi:hypothetical protein
MLVKVLWGLLYLSMSSIYAATDQKESVLVVPAKTSYRIPSGVKSLVKDVLVLEEGSALYVPEDVTQFTIKTKKSKFANHTTIIAKGADGKWDEAAKNGIDLELDLGVAIIHDLTIITDGGNGGNGRNGMLGISGRNASCNPLVVPENGGDGYPGGNGTDGGSPGNIHVMLSKKSDPLNIHYQMNGGSGGQGGAGGEGGYGGKGMNDCESNHYLYTYPNALNGRSGGFGKNGEPGKGVGTRIISFY